MLKNATIFSLAIFTNFIASTADAQHRQHHRARAGQGVIVCDQRGCSDRVKAAPQRVIDANGNPGVIGGRPAGCPRRFCGCEASLYVFGKIRPELNLAANWIRKFPRTTPAPGMVAARPGHVMVLMRHVSGNDWLVHDGNSGGGLTREHVRSIRGHVIVDPRGTRSASSVN